MAKKAVMAMKPCKTSVMKMAKIASMKAPETIAAMKAPETIAAMKAPGTKTSETTRTVKAPSAVTPTASPLRDSISHRGKQTGSDNTGQEKPQFHRS
jgi:predicted RNA-binding Zn ribbon-like protein